MLRGLFRTRNLDDILKNTGGPQFALKRTLGAFNVTLIGVGAIIGTGIFATVGSAAALGFLALVVGLFTVPHDIGIKALLEAATTASHEQHLRTLIGMVLILGGLVLGIVGSGAVAKTTPPDNNVSKGEGEA